MYNPAYTYDSVHVYIRSCARIHTILCTYIYDSVHVYIWLGDRNLFQVVEAALGLPRQDESVPQILETLPQLPWVQKHLREEEKDNRLRALRVRLHVTCPLSRNT
jgi:hypothetical protein